MNPASRSVHVLPTASNLMGFCLIVQASLHATGYSAKSSMDEITAAATCLFMASCLFSYLSIRTLHEQRGRRLETTADVSFIAGLLLLLVMVLLMTFNLVR
jgi:hypothetical protein